MLLSFDWPACCSSYQTPWYLARKKNTHGVNMNSRNSQEVISFTPFFSILGERIEVSVGDILNMDHGLFYGDRVSTVVMPLVVRVGRKYRLLNKDDRRISDILSYFDVNTRVEVFKVSEKRKKELNRIEYLAGQVFPQITSSVSVKDFLSDLADSKEKQVWVADSYGLRPQRNNTDAPLTIAGLTELLGSNGPSHVTVGKILGKNKTRKAKPAPPPPKPNDEKWEWD